MLVTAGMILFAEPAGDLGMHWQHQYLGKEEKGEKQSLWGNGIEGREV